MGPILDTGLKGIGSDIRNQARGTRLETIGRERKTGIPTHRPWPIANRSCFHPSLCPKALSINVTTIA
jgi:hypothetical protein